MMRSNSWDSLPQNSPVVFRKRFRYARRHKKFCCRVMSHNFICSNPGNRYKIFLYYSPYYASLQSAFTSWVPATNDTDSAMQHRTHEPCKNRGSL